MTTLTRRVYDVRRMPPVTKYQDAEEPERWFRMMLLVVCVNLRAQGDLDRREVAHLAGVSDNTIARFEKGQHFPKMERVDRYIAAYAEAGGLKDPFALVEMIASYWRLNGKAPLTAPAAKAYARVAPTGDITVAEVLQDISATPSPASAEPISTRKRRAKKG